MKIYNTLTRKLEDFKPIENKKVRFYHCGPTVYWVQHIGNLRAMVWADLIRRSLLHFGYQVTFVRNYTDVGHLVSDQDTGEDKMEKSVRREGLSPKAIADKYIGIFEKDTKDLNIIDPDFKPRATEYIKQMQDMITVLLQKGYAYITPMAVVFDVSKFANYNNLNRQNLQSNIKHAGKGNVDDPGKKHFADFNLWVFKKGTHENALQTWPSPWGEGFPGWHIECSVMAKVILGDTLDIHMGGIEHIPVHHTNEIAQSEAANGVPFVNYWLHNEHLNVNERKMAKSEGTGFTLDEIRNKNYDPIILRYFFLSSHYRSKQNFTWEALEGAHEAYMRLKDYISAFRRQGDRETLSQEKLHEIDQFRKDFNSSLANDFQVPAALATMWSMLKSNIPSRDKLDLMFEFDEVLGLKLDEIVDVPVSEDVVKLVEERENARHNKDFALADEYRKKIELKGYTIKDTEKGPEIKKII